MGCCLMYVTKTRFRCVTTASLSLANTCRGHFKRCSRLTLARSEHVRMQLVRDFADAAYARRKSPEDQLLPFYRFPLWLPEEGNPARFPPRESRRLRNWRDDESFVRSFGFLLLFPSAAERADRRRGGPSSQSGLAGKKQHPARRKNFQGRGEDGKEWLFGRQIK